MTQKHHHPIRVSFKSEQLKECERQLTTQLGKPLHTTLSQLIAQIHLFEIDAQAVLTDLLNQAGINDEVVSPETIAWFLQRLRDIDYQEGIYKFTFAKTIVYHGYVRAQSLEDAQRKAWTIEDRTDLADYEVMEGETGIEKIPEGAQVLEFEIQAVE